VQTDSLGREVQHGRDASDESTHTSVAFAVLSPYGEKSRPFRWAMTAYATAIMSTVYVEIHWLVDVAGGLLPGLAAVRIVDWAISGRVQGINREESREIRTGAV